MYNIDELKKIYKLSDEENEHIFNQIIEPLVFDDYKPEEKPRAVIAGGQSGSGKFALMCESKRENANSIIITADNYKPFHPKSTELKKKYPINYVSIVDQDAGLWTGKCLKKAITEKYSYTFEGTLKNTRVMERMKESKENGFEVVLKVMAVSELESLMSIFERYEKEISLEGNGRLVSIEMHNDAYINLPNTVDTIENSDVCDIIEVYISGTSPSKAEIIYSSKMNINGYKNAFEAIEQGRKISFEKTSRTIIDRINQLEQNMINRNASEKEFENFIIFKNYVNQLLSNNKSVIKKRK